MLPSHEALDRTGGLAREGLLAPLRHRDFRRLWGAMCVSLAGDGIFLVALAWQVYTLSNAPSALGIVGIAMTIPTIACLLLGGVVSDRHDRRLVMVGADIARWAAMVAMAALSLTGALRLWEIVVLATIYGTGQAFFAPAFDAIVPDVLEGENLAQANALDQVIRPLMLRFVGPALGGVVVATLGAGWAFGLDALSFIVSGVTLLAIAPRVVAVTREQRSVAADLREGWRFVAARPWLWATLASAAIAYLLFMGPVEVLVPYVVKHGLGGSGLDLGLVFAAGGLGSVGCAIAVGRRGIPRRSITAMYLVWALATLAVAGYGVAGAIWQLMLVSLVFSALETAGTIVWATVKQRNVPSSLLGRVSSLDWLISIGLLPVSFALTGPAAAAFGAQTVLIGGGVLGAAVTLAALVVPGVREVERVPVLAGA